MIATASLILLCLACVWLAWIDLRDGIISDRLNLLVATTGFVRTAALAGWAPALALLGQGVLIGAIVWLLRWLYFRYRKFQGLGLGDVKLLAASTVWIGVAGVPMQLLVASVTALAAAGVMQLSKRTVTRQTALPFGPFLALGLLAVIVLQQRGLIE
ncbi:MAG: prepilin peptidase [Bradyrhizobium sp.]|uniref:prepilin peptidase n=1 Tax=Bradyrhizobium sp. TaxID=376 RepID=UPI001EB3F612|nr:A24 family peptidase [Bradyrhizobium sp.]MBU6456575.1 A24 family peptidase [Bradyrhizobium sp.]MDE2329296.1 prepilin peptidase [Bradyrhizobium sp.]MDE2603299.1 prepilin peptidase [Bradyrhizobium sp.]